MNSPIGLDPAPQRVGSTRPRALNNRMRLTMNVIPNSTKSKFNKRLNATTDSQASSERASECFPSSFFSSFFFFTFSHFLFMAHHHQRAVKCYHAYSFLSDAGLLPNNWALQRGLQLASVHCSLSAGSMACWHQILQPALFLYFIPMTTCEWSQCISLVSVHFGITTSASALLQNKEQSRRAPGS